MREVKAVKINTADFAPYGTFCSMTEPVGYPLQGEIHKFYPDRISGTSIGSIAFSPIAVRKDERIVKMAEYHTTTWEGIVALDDDMIIHVAPASGGTPVPELTKAFLVPKGYMVKINGEEKEIAGKNLLEYLLEAGFEPERVVVERNLDIIPKDELGNTIIQDEDVIEVLRFVGGG